MDQVHSVRILADCWSCLWINFKLINLMVRNETPKICQIMLWLSSTPIMAIQTLPATFFPLVKLRQHVKPAALLAEALLLAADDHHRRLGVRLADSVPPVVLPAPAEVGPAPVDGAGLRAAATARRAGPPPTSGRPHRPGSLGQPRGEILKPRPRMAPRKPPPSPCPRKRNLFPTKKPSRRRQQFRAKILQEAK